MTTVLRASAPHEFLAAIPALAGYRPRRSFVCVPFSGSRTSGLIRYDLPADSANRELVSRTAIGLLCRLPDVDGVVPVVYTDRTTVDAGALEWDLLEGFTARARDAGFRVRDAFVVAADGWTTAAEPGVRHPLALIEPSEHVQPGTADVFEDPTDIDAALAARVAAALAELEAERDHEPEGQRAPETTGIHVRLGDRVDPVLFGEEILGREGALDADELAWLAHLARIPVARDALLMQAAFGPVVGEIALEQAERMLRARATDAVEDLTDDRVGGGATGPEDDADDLVLRLLLGESGVRPDAARLRRAIALLVHAAAHTPPSYRAGLLCIAAWSAWALGRGSAAGRLLDQALDTDPEHPMAGLLQAFVSSGAVPEWAFARPIGAVSDR